MDVADAIIIEDADDSPFANVLAWNSENDDNETIQKLDELLHSDEVAEYIEETWPEGGYPRPVKPTILQTTTPRLGLAEPIMLFLIVPAH